MSRPIETFEAKKTVVSKAHLQIMEIEPGLYVYQEVLKKVSSKNDEASTFKMGSRGESSHTRQGFLDESGRLAILDGKTVSNLPLSVISMELKEKLRVKGYSSCMEELPYDKTINIWDMFQSDPSLTHENLVRFDHGNHMAFSHTGEPLPMALIFDYISSRIDESSHDIQALAKHLLARKDTVVLKEMGNSRKANVKAKTIQEAVFHIPDYNADEGRSQSVQFIWSPTHAAYLDLYQRAVAKVGKDKVYPTVLRTMVIEDDLLDIKQFTPQAPSRRPSF